MGRAEAGAAQQRTGPRISLRSKIILVLMVVVGLYAASDFYVRARIIAPSFAEVESKEAKEDIDRVVRALRQEIEMLHELSLNWSRHDLTYEFVGKPYEEFHRRELAPERLRTNHVDLLYVCDSEGVVLAHHLEDPDHPLREAQLRMFPTLKLDAKHPLLGEERSGLLLTELGPLLVSSRPIQPSTYQAESRGWLILGRFLKARVNEELAVRTQVEFDFWQLNGSEEIPPAEEELLDDLTTTPDYVVVERESGELYAYATFSDISNRPDVLLRAHIPRDIGLTGARAMRYAAFSMFAICLVGILALMALLQRIVLSPLSSLTAHAVRIGLEEDFSAKLALDRRDEIGTLAGEFDAMMAKLAEARRDLIKTARAAGMSEIATGILHNVGNVLNSVNVSAAMIGERAREMGTEDVVELARVLESNSADLAGFVSNDPRGKHLQPYISALASHLDGQKSNILDEIHSLTEGIDHIRDLIRSQQDYAGRSDLSESVRLPGLVDQALEITEKALGRDAKLVVHKHYEEVPAFHVDRHKVLEILVNLLQNARQAMAASAVEEHRLDISVRLEGEKQVLLAVQDNGVGIDSGQLVKVFQLGFTTKRDGHGFGLHSSANAAIALGGSLVVKSEGSGKGARFELRLPLGSPLATEAAS